MTTTDFFQSLGHALINSLWQLALLSVVFQVWLACFPYSKAATRSKVATWMLVSGFVWFVLSIFNGPAIIENSDVLNTVFFQDSSTINKFIAQFSLYAGIIYLLLFTIPAVNFVRNVQYVNAIRKKGLQKADVPWRLFVQQISARMGIKRSVQIWLSEMVQTPVTVGFLRPVILLPIAAINQLQTDQVEAILLHELAHIRRYDYMLNFVVRIIQTVLYFNPFVRAFAQIIDTEREKSCDEMVMQFQYNAHDYASALLVLERSSAPRLAMAAAGTQRGQQLMGRVENILGIQRKTRVSLLRLSGTLVALCMLAGLHVFLNSEKNDRALAYQDMTAFMDSPFIMSAEATGPQQTVARETETHNDKEYQSASDIHIPLAVVKPPLPPKAPAPLEPSENYGPAEWYKFVTDRENILSEAEQQEIEKAIQSSQRVLEEIQWKTIEKEIADALTSAEKELVREKLKQESREADWKRLEEKMKQAYANINWSALNAELSSAVTDIRLDSLQQVVNEAVLGLAQLGKELDKAKVEGIPDTDITREAVEAKRLSLERTLDTLKKADRIRRVIKL
jgi:beta-lactamase regulating signal transducer with metallopeptidase domain